MIPRPSSQEGPFEQIANVAAVSDVDAAIKAMTQAELKPHTLALQDYRRRTSAEITEVWQESAIEPLCVTFLLLFGMRSYRR